VPVVPQYTICSQEYIKTLNFSPRLPPPPPLLSLGGSIFSRNYMITAPWICKLTTLYLYLHTMSPINRGPFQYLANYLITRSQVCGIQHLCPMFRHIQHIFPLSSSRVLSFSSYILSRLSIIAGSNVGGLTYLHLHLYPHMANLTDRCSFAYLANFMPVVVGLALSNSVASCSVIYILH
jgi:hypothetical protein